MLINHIFNFHKKKNNGRQNHFWTVKNRVLENVIHVSYIQIPCSYNMYFEKKNNLSDTRTDGRGKLHVYSILMEQTDNN